MSEARIGGSSWRACTGIGDVLPMRQEFYEHCSTPTAAQRRHRCGPCCSARLPARRGRGIRADRDARRRYAADCTGRLGGSPPPDRRLPVPCALALRSESAGSSGARPRGRAVCALHRVCCVDLRGSLFCDVRDRSQAPLCGFYAAAFVRVLERFALAADADVSACRATVPITAPDDGHSAADNGTRRRSVIRLMRDSARRLLLAAWLVWLAPAPAARRAAADAGDAVERARVRRTYTGSAKAPRFWSPTT